MRYQATNGVMIAVMKAQRAKTGPSQTGHTKMPTSRPQQACDVCYSSTIVDWTDMSLSYIAQNDDLQRRAPTLHPLTPQACLMH